jgi:hypothetical protein
MCTSLLSGKHFNFLRSLHSNQIMPCMFLMCQVSAFKLYYAMHVTDVSISNQDRVTHNVALRGHSPKKCLGGIHKVGAGDTPEHITCAMVTAASGTVIVVRAAAGNVFCASLSLVTAACVLHSNGML